MCKLLKKSYMLSIVYAALPKLPTAHKLSSLNRRYTNRTTEKELTVLASVYLYCAFGLLEMQFLRLRGLVHTVIFFLTKSRSYKVPGWYLLLNGLKIKSNWVKSPTKKCHLLVLAHSLYYNWAYMNICTRYILDVLCRQQIKLFQVVSTSEFHEYWWNHLKNIFLVPAAFCRASEASNIDYFKNFNSSLKNRYFGALIFLEREFFDP